ncbi:MAG: hypothetical protein IT208_05455 [Chthonomonadales bacterium]|nr:hypothetical protein [Chthonomonadales bacterium]
MKRADKIRMAAEAAAQAAAADDRDQGARDDARREWGRVRKAAREAYLAGQDWKAILTAFRDGEGFYTSDERARMAAAYADELIMSGLR